MQSLKQRLRDDFPRLAFTGAFLLAAAGTCVVLGGLAAITNFCIENQPLGLGNGFKLEAVSVLQACAPSKPRVLNRLPQRDRTARFQLSAAIKPAGRCIFLTEPFSISPPPFLPLTNHPPIFPCSP